ncbi:hypothetical protein MTO96_049555 [Rhipicephalus appendiculatus]
MKAIILLTALAVANAGYVGHAGYGHGYGHGYGVVAKVAEAGSSSQHRSQDLAGNYNFGYKEGHTSGGSFRQEAGDAWGNKVGSYGLTDADGRVRVVKYVADGHGFRAHISTNEPGTAASHPAAAAYNARHAIHAAGYGVAAPVAKSARKRKSMRNKASNDDESYTRVSNEVPKNEASATTKRSRKQKKSRGSRTPHGQEKLTRRQPLCVTLINQSSRSRRWAAPTFPDPKPGFPVLTTRAEGPLCQLSPLARAPSNVTEAKKCGVPHLPSRSAGGLDSSPGPLLVRHCAFATQDRQYIRAAAGRTETSELAQPSLELSRRSPVEYEHTRHRPTSYEGENVVQGRAARYTGGF